MVSLNVLKEMGRLLRTGNAAMDWLNWEDNFRDYSSKSNLSAKPAPKQAATLRYAIGALGREIMKSFELNESQRNDMEYILRMLREYFMPTAKSKSPRSLRVTKVKSNVRTGDLCTWENEWIIRNKLEEIKDLKLEKTEEMCLLEENTMEKMRAIDI